MCLPVRLSERDEPLRTATHTGCIERPLDAFIHHVLRDEHICLLRTETVRDQPLQSLGSFSHIAGAFSARLLGHISLLCICDHHHGKGDDHAQDCVTTKLLEVDPTHTTNGLCNLWTEGQATTVRKSDDRGSISD